MAGSSSSTSRATTRESIRLQLVVPPTGTTVTQTVLHELGDIALDSTCPAAKAISAAPGLLKLPCPSLLTAGLWNALLFQIIQVEAVLFGSTFEATAWDEEPAGWHIASSLGTNIFQRISYAQLTLLLLPLSLGFVWCLLGRSKGNRILATLTMALFTFSSLLLLAALHWRGVSGQNGCSDVQGMSSQAATAAVNAPAFTLPPSADVGLNILPNIKDPEAVDPQATCPGYMASNVQVTESSLTAELTLAGPACNVYGNDIEHLTLSVEIQADDRVHIQIQPRFIGPQNETWFILPEVLVPRPSDNAGQCRTSSNRSRMSVSWSNDPTFSFTVARMDTGDTLFSTKGTRLVYQDQFIEFVSSLPENYNLYGLGEVIHGFRLGNNLTRTIYAADVGDIIDANIYGSHPIYLDTRYFTVGDSGNLTYAPYATDKATRYVSYTHGVFLRNAHAQEVLLKPSGITWRALGGTIDLYFYSGPKAEDVMKAYQQTMTGLPAMQQYWTLGFHQCRWGYENWTVVEDVVDNFAKFEIPLETIWTDIDYMKGYRNFENDPVRYSYDEGAQFLSKLHANHQHYVPIIDAAIYASNPNNPNDAYPPYDRGVEADAFLLNPDGSTYIGAVWPGYTVFPDLVGAVLNGTGGIDWWINEVSLWSEKVAFDGIWIDMSEVASFCVGSCGTGNLTLNPAHPPFQLPGEPGNLVLTYPEGFERTNSSEAMVVSSALNALPTPTGAVATTTSYLHTKPTPGSRNVNWPPYAINNNRGDLAVHAVSPNATHHGGTLEYDFHNLYGHLLLNATYQALLNVHNGKRPFIIGRSTFAGSGKWAGHWGGDNYSLWAYMYFGIPQALSFSIFGIPMFGVDACGFGGNTDYELCSRWMQLSAFFPFYRNHNVLGAISQEPYRWESVATATKAAMRIRYALLPYLYTLMVQASRDGSTVMRALAWEFPNEPWLADADRQFMLGSAVMIVPCLEQGATTVGGVFPGVGDGTVWYDWYELKAVKGVQPGQNVTIDAPLGHIPVYLRGGNVVPIQEPGMTTAESRGNPWGLIVALDHCGQAEGRLYLDDGESLEPSATTWVQFSATNSSISADPRGNFVDKIPLANATILGLEHRPSWVWLDGVTLGSSYWSYYENTGVLSLSGLNDKFLGGAWANKWEIHWE